MAPKKQYRAYDVAPKGHGCVLGLGENGHHPPWIGLHSSIVSM